MRAKVKKILVAVRDGMPLPMQRMVNWISFHFLLSSSERDIWNQRIKDVLCCADNKFIPRHPQAGTVKGGLMTMHNGLKVHAGSYYGWGSHQVLVENKGCHEPQEERAFAEVLRHLKPRSTMLELGSYWAFYSAWFARDIPDANCVMVEPEWGNLAKGKKNFRLNNLNGTFLQGFMGSGHSPEGQPPTLSVDGIMTDQKLKHIHILHSDIQGFEFNMLHGASNALKARAIDYIFISTHSDEVHEKCIEYLESHNYRIWQDIDLESTFSHDGLIVAQRSEMSVLPVLTLDRKLKDS